MTGWRRDGITLATYLATTVIFTWPLATGVLAARHFDAYGLLWLLEGARHGWEGTASLAAFPEGQDLHRVDSVLAWALARGLGWLLPAPALAVGLGLAGPTLSAWAAERASAHVLDARWPWSLLSGFAWAFSGMAATTLLEGQLYSLFNPWLPLLAWTWHRALPHPEEGHPRSGSGPQAPMGRVRDGALSGLLWHLCLWTSGYAGVAATLLVVGLGIRRRVSWKVLGAAAGVALPLGGAWAWYVLQAPETTVGAAAAWSPLQNMRNGSAALMDLLAWSPSADAQRHSMAPVLGAVPLSLALFAPVVLRGRPGPWRAWLGLAVLAILLSLGPSIRMEGNQEGWPWILAPLASSALAPWFRFPARLLGLAGLALGLVAARVATDLARSHPRRTAVLLVAAVLDALVASGAPFRNQAVPLDVPSAYARAPSHGALLELVPDLHGYAADMGHHVLDFTCTYQRAHGRPTLNACLNPLVPMGPAVQVRRWLTARLLSEMEPSQTRDRLAALGVGAIALHGDLYPPHLRHPMEQGLAASLGPPVASTRDGGEGVALYLVPEAAADPLGAWRALEEEGW